MIFDYSESVGWVFAALGALCFVFAIYHREIFHKQKPSTKDNDETAQN